MKNIKKILGYMLLLVFINNLSYSSITYSNSTYSKPTDTQGLSSKNVNLANQVLDVWYNKNKEYSEYDLYYEKYLYFKKKAVDSLEQLGISKNKRVYVSLAKYLRDGINKINEVLNDDLSGVAEGLIGTTSNNTTTSTTNSSSNINNTSSQSNISTNVNTTPISPTQTIISTGICALQLSGWNIINAEVSYNGNWSSVNNTPGYSKSECSEICNRKMDENTRGICKWENEILKNVTQKIAPKCSTFTTSDGYYISEGTVGSKQMGVRKIIDHTGEIDRYKQYSCDNAKIWRENTQTGFPSKVIKCNNGYIIKTNTGGGEYCDTTSSSTVSTTTTSSPTVNFNKNTATTLDYISISRDTKGNNNCQYSYNGESFQNLPSNIGSIQSAMFPAGTHTVVVKCGNIQSQTTISITSPSN